MSSHTQIWWKFDVCNCVYLHISCVLACVVELIWQLLLPWQWSLPIIPQGCLEMATLGLNPAKTNMQGMGFPPRIKHFQMTPFTFRNGDSKQEQSLQLSLRTFSFYSLQPFKCSNHNWQFLYVQHKVAFNGNTTWNWPFKIGFWMAAQQHSFERFSWGLPVSNVFYLEASVHFHFLSTLTFSSLISACPLSSPLCVFPFFSNINFASPISSVIFTPHIHVSLSSTSAHLSVLSVLFCCPQTPVLDFCIYKNNSFNQTSLEAPLIWLAGKLQIGVLVWMETLF